MDHQMFTERVKKVMALAREESQRLGHDYGGLSTSSSDLSRKVKVWPLPRSSLGWIRRR